MPLQIQPIDFSEACEFVSRLHRHHRPPLGSKLQIAVNDGVEVVGVIIAGRPVSRHLDDGITLEVTRCCTNGTFNACSILYAAAWRAAKALGYSRMVTYTLPEEGGASLKGAGWIRVAEVKGTPWTNNVRKRADDHPLGDKWRWEVSTGQDANRIRVVDEKEPTPDLFANVV